MNDWKKCIDGCGAKYRGAACPYCMTVEAEDDIFERMRTATADDFLYNEASLVLLTTGQG